MDKEELNKLIKELEGLQIRQEVIIKKIRASTEEAQAADRPASSRTTQEKDDRSSFQVGQKVLIKNRLGHLSFGQKASIKDRAGTVTKLTRKRVHIKTCNGNDTSRAPQNITLLNQQEYEVVVSDI